MKVILTQHVENLGEVGEIHQVADGFGRNYLLPKGLAILATPGAAKQIDDLRRTEDRRQDRLRSEMQDLARRIEGLDLRFTAKVGETGRLYGSITSSDIATEISEQLDIEIDRRKIDLPETIRSLGEHAIPIHLLQGVTATAKVQVEADEELVKDLPAEELEGDDVDEEERDDEDYDYDDDEYDDYDDYD